MWYINYYHDLLRNFFLSPHIHLPTLIILEEDTGNHAQGKRKQVCQQEEEHTNKQTKHQTEWTLSERGLTSKRNAQSDTIPSIFFKTPGRNSKRLQHMSEEWLGAKSDKDSEGWLRKPMLHCATLTGLRVQVGSQLLRRQWPVQCDSAISHQ